MEEHAGGFIRRKRNPNRRQAAKVRTTENSGIKGKTVIQNKV